MTGGMQTSVNVQPSPAVEGDFASKNPRFSVLVGPGGFVAGPGGVTVGRFAWAYWNTIDPDNAPAIVQSSGLGVGLMNPVSGAPTGFVGRRQQALIITYLADASMLIQAGYQMSL